MLNPKWKTMFVGAALCALAIGAGPSSAQDSDNQEPTYEEPNYDEAPLLRSCEEAYVGLTSLAIGDDGAGVREFLYGQVVVLLVDQVEPAAAAFGIVILATDPESEMGDRRCFAVTQLNAVDLDAATAELDGERSVTLTIPVRDFDEETGSREGKPLVMTANVETGEVTATR
jgi:hypothetical protein